MDIKEFSGLARNRFDKCYDMVTKSKHKEYSRRGDKLHNFKEAGKINDCSPESALWGMVVKQVVSVKDLIADIEAGKTPSMIMVEEKISDVINYMVLLEALISERQE
jgi:hypothetical protein